MMLQPTKGLNTLKTIQALFAVISLIVFAGCASTCCHSFAAQLSQLQQGMSKDQVMQLLGKPSEAGTGTRYDAPNTTIASGFSEVFRYTQTSGGQTKDWLVVFVGGKV